LWLQNRFWTSGDFVESGSESGSELGSDADADSELGAGTGSRASSALAVKLKHDKYVTDHPLGKLRKDQAVRHAFSSKRDKSSTDRLKRVAGLLKSATDNSDHSHVELINSNGAKLQLDVPFAVLGSKEGTIFMVVCTVERLTLDGKPVSALSSDDAADAGARVAGRVMTMVARDDGHVQWKLGAYGDTSEWVASDVQPLCIEPSADGDAVFAFSISELSEIAAALFTAHSSGCKFAQLHGTKIPYCGADKKQLFVVACEEAELGASSVVTCGVCEASIPLGKMQLHIGYHIAHNHAKLAPDPCGFCGTRPASHCKTMTKKTKVTTSCPLFGSATGVYSSLALLKRISKPQPCTNHPIKCTANQGCHGFTWSQTVKQHFDKAHGGNPVPEAMQIEVSGQERKWVECAGPKAKEVPNKWAANDPGSWK
jgi:hypothetical protein